MFQGFTEETVQFMWGIRFNNRRDWFLEHKHIYQQQFYEPLKELAAEVQAKLLERNPGLELNVKVARIYRDARVVRDGRPYKDHLWFSLRRPSETRAGHPSFWFEAAPEGYSMGIDYWVERVGDMQSYRDKILADPKRVEALTALLNSRTDFTINGEDYKRPKAQVSADLAPWFHKKRGVWLSRGLPYEDGCSFYGSELVEEIAQNFQWLMPFYQWMGEINSECGIRNAEL